MPPSQLKQLKASLRESGLAGPQKSKKQRKAGSKDGAGRIQRNAALQDIRERFNPFEVKAPARKDKFDVVSSKKPKTGSSRPGVTRGLGEERRKATLLKEMQSRNKVGGLLDRRFGENDPSMTPEQRAAERFARQSLRKSRKSELFNLEDEEDGGVELTHAGRALFGGDENGADDFQEEVPGLSDESDNNDVEDIDDRPRKRLRLDEDDVQEHEDAHPALERRKTKKEVMKEVIAKSKLHRYERQQAKEDDDDLRAELDKGMTDLFDAMRGHKATPKPLPTPPSTDSEPAMNPERAAMLAGKDRQEVEKEYEKRVREMLLDKRARPTSRTKTEEEKAMEEAERLQELEAKRIRRMKGDVDSSDEEIDDARGVEEDDYPDDAEAFGLAQPAVVPYMPDLDVEDEDEFVMDDLVASDSDAEPASDLEEDSASNASISDDGDDDFINGLVLPEAKSEAGTKASTKTGKSDLAYTFPCPQTHDELLQIAKGGKIEDLPVIIQRIRALYHLGLSQDNRAKLENFVAVLVEHIAYLGQHANTPPTVLEILVRHVHSMAKSLPEAVGSAFRSQLRQISDERPLNLTTGDLILLTGISTIFPTSDHFHPVVTPAMLIIARYLGQSSVQKVQELGIGLYACTLALQSQSLAKRYMPEVITYLTNALVMLAPVPMPEATTSDPSWMVSLRMTGNDLRMRKSAKLPGDFVTIAFQDLYEYNASEEFKVDLLCTTLKLFQEAAVAPWKGKSAFDQIFDTPIIALNHYLSKLCAGHLNGSVMSVLKLTHATLKAHRQSCILTRVPLALHAHRPLAIKSSIPKFEESFNPDKHYDPDRDRSQLAKLKAEHKRERKGAMRELRKDANFVGREQLKEKKSRDEAYEKKFKRLVAEIQGEEGAEGKKFERERKRK